MPDSYGAVFAGLGLCGASRVEAAIDTPTNSATSTIIARIGRYWTTSPPPFGRRLPPAIHRASTDAAAPRARARRDVAPPPAAAPPPAPPPTRRRTVPPTSARRAAAGVGALGGATIAVDAGHNGGN